MKLQEAFLAGICGCYFVKGCLFGIIRVKHSYSTMVIINDKMAVTLFWNTNRTVEKIYTYSAKNVGPIKLCKFLKLTEILYVPIGN